MCTISTKELLNNMSIVGHENFSISKAIDTELYKMSNVWRYTSRLIIRPENLAEHSYYVATNVVKFGKLLGVSEDRINKAVRVALAHDTAETLTSDLPHNLKEYSPELNKICEELEVKLISEYFPYFKDDYLDFYNDVDPMVNLLVKLADVVDVIMFINREETLGNRDEDILQIRAECNERFIKIKLDLIEALEKEKGNK